MKKLLALAGGLALALGIALPAAAAPARPHNLMNVVILNDSSSLWLTSNGLGNPITTTTNDGGRWTQKGCVNTHGESYCEWSNAFGLCLTASTSTGQVHGYDCTGADQQLWWINGDNPYGFINDYWTNDVLPVSNAFMHEHDSSNGSPVYGNCSSGCDGLAHWDIGVGLTA